MRLLKIRTQMILEIPGTAQKEHRFWKDEQKGTKKQTESPVGATRGLVVLRGPGVGDPGPSSRHTGAGDPSSSAGHRRQRPQAIPHCPGFSG